MSIFSRHFWRSLGPIMRRPLLYQPFLIAAYILRAIVWTLAATLVCFGRVLAVVAGQSAFIFGIALCLVGQATLGAPMSVIGFVASRVAA